MTINEIGSVSSMLAQKPIDIKPTAEPNQRQENQKKAISENDMAELVSVVNEFVQSIGTKVGFSYDTYNDRQVILVKDTETDEVIREIPPKEMLKLLKQLERVTGLIYHNHI